jgi:soluble lytic murein transglycosylase-like protein
MRFQTEIVQASVRHGLDAQLIAGLIGVESDFDPYAWNPEPRYHYFWDVRNHKPFRTVSVPEMLNKFPPRDFPTVTGDPDQEWWGQQASWGLMQVMGAVARENGFAGLYLPELSDPITNLSIGCLQFGKLLLWAKGDVEQALSAWNGGKMGNMIRPFRNQAYATKVIAERSSLKLV